MTNNPAFGLNALGGALNLQMKDGFTYQGAEIDIMGGSFGRIQGSAQWGKQVDKNYAVYGALEGVRDNGFRNFSQSEVRRFYGDVGYKAGDSEFHVNMGVAKNDFGASATVPAELLDKYWGATLHHAADHVQPRRLSQPDRKGRCNADLDASKAPRMCAGSSRSIVDGNPTDAQECACGSGAAVLWRRHHGRANGAGGVQLANPFAPGTILGADRSGLDPFDHVRRVADRPPTPISCSAMITAS